MRRLWAGLGMAVALAAITAGGIVIAQDDAPAAGEANAFVVNTGAGSCTRSATPIDYATASSNGWTCGTLDAAFDAASAGDLVYVRCASGTTCSYSAQTVSGDHGSATDVTIQAEPGYTITVGVDSIPYDGSNHPDPTGVGVSALHVTFKDMRFPFFATSSNDVTFDNIDGQTWSIGSGADGITVKNGEYGNYQPPSCPNTQDQPTVTGGGGADPTNITIRRNSFHDYLDTSCTSAHFDCLQIAGANGGFLIDANKFINCDDNAVILTADFDANGDMSGITFQNNWVGPTLSGIRSLQWNATGNCSGAVVQYNTLYGAGTDSGMNVVCSTDSSTVFRGNIHRYLDSFECSTGGGMKGVRSYLMGGSGSASSCGTGSTVATLGLVATPSAGATWTTFDYHITDGSAAEASGDPSNCPSGDIDGDATRPEPAATTCDRGSDERS